MENIQPSALVVVALLGGILLLPMTMGFVASLLRQLFSKKAKRSPLPTLLFHAISHDRAMGLSAISPVKFEELCRTIAEKGLTTLTIDQIPSLDPHDNSPKVALTFDDGFADFFATALPILKRYKLTATLFVVAGNIGKSSGWDIYGKRAMINAEEILACDAAGIRIGSHSFTHADLSRLCDVDLRFELIESKRILEELLQKPVDAISFPLGSCSKRVWEAAQACGYRYGATYREIPVSDPHLIPVTGTYRFDTVADLVNKATHPGGRGNGAVRAALMPHFAKGTSVFHFRDNYRA